MNRITTNKSQSRLPILIAVLVAVVLVAGLLIAMLTGVIGGGGERRNTGSTPRYIDIWAVYPDGSIRFAVRFHPGESAGGIVDVAGPLVLSDEQVISAEVIGDHHRRSTSASGFVQPRAGPPSFSARRLLRFRPAAAPPRPAPVEKCGAPQQ